MKALLVVLTLLATTTALAGVKSGSCFMASGDNQVKLLFVIDGGNVTMAYDGDDDPPAKCQLQADDQSDYSILCKGDDPEDNLSITIKGSVGRMLDGQGNLVSELKTCRIR